MVFGIALAHAQVKTMTVQEAVQYAMIHSPTIQNAQLDVDMARAKVKEVKAAGLPQISGSATVMHYPQIQAFVLENQANSPFFNPNLPVDAPVAFGLQLANSLTGTISGTQLLFNGSYLVGLKASKTYTELSAKQLKQAKIALSEQVMKAYYTIVVNAEKSKLFNLNISRLDSTHKETQALFKNGFVEKIDLDRLEVSLNNLKAEKEKTERLLRLATLALKLQMGMPVKDSLQLATTLESIQMEAVTPANTVIDYTRRIEYSSLQTQKALVNLEQRNIKAGYMPSLVLLGTLGVNSAASKFENLGNFSEKNRYVPYSYVGASLSLPIFDGFEKNYKYYQAKQSEKKVNNGLKQLENAIDFELSQSNISLENARTNLRIQDRNLKLATEVVRVSKVKYRQGVGSNLEVTNAESDLKEAQTNYYTALYDLVIAKIDLDKAQGNLVTD